MPPPRLPRPVAFVLFALALSRGLAADGPNPAALPPLPQPVGVPRPAEATDRPYEPQPIVAGAVILPLYPAGSPELNPQRIREPEVYQYWGPGRLGAIVNVHNPSIEFHAGDGQLNTGTAVIVAAGGGHQSLNVGTEAAPIVPFLAQHGISTLILNRLRRDGYEPTVDGVNDALQAIRLVRAYAKAWNIDPDRIGIMGFSAGAELAMHAGMFWEEFDRKHANDGDALKGISARPDFVVSVYPGPSPFARGAKPAIPRAAPPAFIAGPGWADWVHAVWANEYFAALLADGVPNVEIHLYARGHHPGDKTAADEPPATGGLANMGGIAFGTWSARYLEWMRDLGFLDRPGVRTRAANDVAANLQRTPRSIPPPPPPARVK